MIAYRVKVIGSNDSYLITSQQRPDVEQAMAQGGNGIVRIGGNVIMANSIRSLTEVSVDLYSCPAYFQEQVRLEQGTTKTPIGQNCRRLPTKWIILGKGFRPISTSVSTAEIERISKALLEAREENKPLAHFVIAKCHYHIGIDGELQFHTKLEEIPEALECVPNAEYPKQVHICQISKFGVLQIN